MIRDAMPEQHREFFAQLPFVIAGTVDQTGQPWAFAEVVFKEIPAKLTLLLDCLPDSRFTN